MNHWQRCFVVGAMVLLAGGCDSLSFGTTAIREIVAAPGQFDGKEVKVKGTASAVTRLPLVDVRMYLLRDDSGEITVIARDQLPAENAKVVVRGTVRTAAILGGQPIGLRIEEAAKQ